MADTTITGLPSASTLTGSERVPMDQSGTTVDAAASAIAALATKATVGLSNVDNTSDLNKPVSTAQQAAFATAAQGTDSRPPLYATTTTYTASGAIAPTDRVAIINAASAVTMTLASGSSDGQSLTVKRLGAGAVTITASLDNASSSIVADSTTIKESVLLAWSSSLSTWLIL